MNVLVVGGTRFIGRQLVESLIKNGHAVTVLSRGNTRPVFSAGVKTVWADRTDKATLKALAQNQFDAIFDNNAYDGAVVQSLRDAFASRSPKYFLTSTAWIYAATAPKEDASLTEAVFSPDTQVTGKQAAQIFDSLELPTLTKDYLRGKVSAEHAAWTLDGDVTIFRPAMVSGLNDHNRRIEEFVRRKPKLAGSDHSFQLLWAADLAEAMTQMLSAQPKGKSVFNVAPAERVKRADISRWVEEVLKETKRSERREDGTDPFSIHVPGHFDSSRLMKACPHFKFAPAERWIKETAGGMLNEAVAS